MQTRPMDGSLLLSELRDDAVLRSNILPAEVSGVEAVKQALAALDALCPAQTLIACHRLGNREILCTQARLDSGEEVQITTVGLRDETGWICAVFSGHSPESAATHLRRLYKKL